MPIRARKCGAPLPAAPALAQRLRYAATNMVPPPHMEPALGIVLIPIPSRDFDPTEVAVPWKVLQALGHTVQFATPDGRPGQADERMVIGHGLGIWKAVLRADANARQAYAEMVASPAFMQPRRYSDLRVGDFDGLILPGGHAPGMRPYLQSSVLQALVVAAFEQGRPLVQHPVNSFMY